jgi:hypothetical protein
MTGTEDRLARALRARTDLITHDQLRPMAPPAVVSHIRWRRTGAYALVAAACAAALSIPVVLVAGGDRGNDPIQQPGPTNVATTNSSPAPSPTVTVSAKLNPALPPFVDANAAGVIVPGEAAALADNRWGITTLSVTAPDETTVADVLRVTWSDGTMAKFTLPAESATPQVSTTLVNGDSAGILVTWESGPQGVPVQRVYSTAGFDLTEIFPQSAFGLTASEDGGNPRSVLSVNGTIYTMVEAGGPTRINLYSWSAGDHNLLLANKGRNIGTYCLVEGPVTWKLC